MRYCVYILRSLKDGGLYTGCTQDLVARIAYHRRGSSLATKHRRPLEVVYVEWHSSRSEACARERQLKTLEGGPEKFELVAGQTQEDVVELNRLYNGD